ncbi:hypothetical protein HWV62_44087 [Athelia sp. TMB]|nr:hypothetical protein HWV62_44087 [Athelia sp. TMB]
MASSSRSLLERIAIEPNDSWSHDVEAADNAFQPRQRRPKRPRELEYDSEYLFAPWSEGLASEECGNKTQRLHDEIVAYTEYVTPTAQEKDTRTKVFEHIKSAIKTRFPRSEVHLFGSVAHDLCLPDGSVILSPAMYLTPLANVLCCSDLDVVVELPGIDHPLDKKNCLFQLSRALKASGATNDVFVNHFAKVPVATFVTVPNFGSYSFDIGINNIDGLKAVTIIGAFLDQMPALRPLVLVLKSFLKQRKLGSAATGGLSSYGVICAVISFLQLNPTKVPSESLNNPLETKSLGTLLMDFLSYFGSTFPLDECYISVTQGKLLPKDSADWISGRNKLSIECLVDPGPSIKQVGMVDDTDSFPENDVGRSAGKITQILEAFLDAHKAFEHTPLMPTNSASILGDNKLARITQKVLVTLFFDAPWADFLTYQTLDQRQHICNLANSGNLLVRMPVDRYADYRSQRRGGYNDRQSKSQYRPSPRRDSHVDDSYHSRGYEDTGSGYRNSSGPSKRRRV